VDFAYSLHTDLGHRCRGARVDGAMVPLNTPLNGQTVEVIAAKEGGPSLDWLNPELGYLRARARAPRCAPGSTPGAGAATIARGRELVEKLLQREGRTALKLDTWPSNWASRAPMPVRGGGQGRVLAAQHREPAAPGPRRADRRHAPRSSARAPAAGRGGVLVVGVDSLLTTLARCCRPAPPDAIGGFVTRGKGVAIHRATAATSATWPRLTRGRVIEWPGARRLRASEAVYPLDVLVEAADRPACCATSPRSSPRTRPT
jgi:GTP pyrophosphokinase